ncbi:MAG: hypothetical protein EOO59_07505 [Hymenobacter sp.]|nr:MAG: hypothetical protein EOO59_07505 [Hymenobacter sp.]
MSPKFAGSDSFPSAEACDYGLRFMQEDTPHYARLKIGASTDGTGLLLRLSDCLPPPFYCLYVLVIGRGGSPAGRYQSPLLSSRAALTDFVLEYKHLLEHDGRHHLWIGTPDGSATLVYDKHNLVYAYGPLAAFRQQLLALGYVEQAVEIPYPHAHSYAPENDAATEELLQYWEWQHFPLQETDEE